MKKIAFICFVVLVMSSLSYFWLIDFNSKLIGRFPTFQNVESPIDEFGNINPSYPWDFRMMSFYTFQATFVVVNHCVAESILRRYPAGVYFQAVRVI